MGGPGSGGRRSGAGRKPKPKHLRVIDGGADHRTPAANDVEAGTGETAVVEPPASLTPEERDVWDRWAPTAIAAKTLVPATLWSFVQLCQAEVDRLELRRRYTWQRSEKTGELKPLLMLDEKLEMSVRREYRSLQAYINARMKDFMLAPLGKEIEGEASPGEEDPLEAFTRRRS